MRKGLILIERDNEILKHIVVCSATVKEGSPTLSQRAFFISNLNNPLNFSLR